MGVAWWISVVLWALPKIIAWVQRQKWLEPDRQERVGEIMALAAQLEPHGLRLGCKPITRAGVS